MLRMQVYAGTVLLTLMATAGPVLAIAEPGPLPRFEPACAVSGATQRPLTGVLTYVDLDGGYYSVDGWMLEGDEELFKLHQGREVTVIGEASDRVTTQMVRSLLVTDLGAVESQGRAWFPTGADLVNRTGERMLPGDITVAGRPVAFDQRSILSEGQLMIPVRAVVEAADGAVSWDSAGQRVTVTLPQRTVVFEVDSALAELSEEGVRYIQQNRIRMAAPAMLVNGRMLISADALTTVLGFAVDEGEGGALALHATGLLQQPADGEAIIPERLEQIIVPVEFHIWHDRIKLEHETACMAIPTEGGIYLGLAGGLRDSGGHRVVVSDLRRRTGGWLATARVVPPTGPTTMALNNPTGFYFLPGATGTVEVRFEPTGLSLGSTAK